MKRILKIVRTKDVETYSYQVGKLLRINPDLQKELYDKIVDYCETDFEWNELIKVGHELRDEMHKARKELADNLYYDRPYGKSVQEYKKHIKIVRKHNNEFEALKELMDKKYKEVRDAISGEKWFYL